MGQGELHRRGMGPLHIAYMIQFITIHCGLIIFYYTPKIILIVSHRGTEITEKNVFFVFFSLFSLCLCEGLFFVFLDRQRDHRGRSIIFRLFSLYASVWDLSFRFSREIHRIPIHIGAVTKVTK